MFNRMMKDFYRGKKRGICPRKKSKMKICTKKWREIVTEKIVLKILSVSSEFLFDRYGRVLK